MRGNPRICVRVNKNTLAKLSQRAEEEGLTVSELVRSIIVDWLEHN